MSQLYVMISSAGPQRDFSKGTREQPLWDEHAEFIDRLVDEGFIVLGGPLADEGGGMLVVRADTEDEVTAKTKDDPWFIHGVLQLESIKRWEVFIGRERVGTGK